MSVSILVSSQGKNLELAKKFLEYFSEKKEKADILDLVALDLPLYSALTEGKLPDRVQDLTKKLVNSKAIIFVAPEYNGSVPPVLNNAIAWVSRTGDDWRHAFNGKPAAIATHSGGGGAHVLMAMRHQLSFIGMNVLGRQVLTNYGKELNTDSMAAVLDQLISID
ncbi:MAG: NADPH-dependent oxidoreductase [Epsilonproteobacteria bacterium]|nr:MAG: NADPH-dependent oxidoreductase [Campylobacterota bacterium]RLA65972.1 MAG: NADPH-dependent oxidoreductase [Campylobacterota bacterium]